MYPLAIFAADIHLSQRTWSKYPTLTGDSFFSLQQLVELATQLRVPLFMAGDIFDQVRPDAGTVAKYVDIVNCATTPVLAINGNHDNTDPPWFSFASKVSSLDLRSFDLGPCTVVGLSFRHAHDLSQHLQLAADVASLGGKRSILLSHQVWQDMLSIGRFDAAFSDIPSFELMVAGDYHVHQVFNGVNADGRPIQVFSPGSTNMRSMRESPDKFVYVLYLDNDQLVFRSHQLRAREFFTATVDSEERGAALLYFVKNHKPDASLPEPLQQPILRVGFADGFGTVARELRQEASGRFHVSEFAIIEQAVLPTGGFDLPTQNLTGFSDVVDTLVEDAQLRADAKQLWQTPRDEVTENINRIVARQRT